MHVAAASCTAFHKIPSSLVHVSISAHFKEGELTWACSYTSQAEMFHQKQRLRLMMTTGRVTRAKHSILERKLLRVHTRLLSCFDGEHRFSSAVNCCHTTHKYSLLQLCSKVQICLWCWERVDETIALFDLSFLGNTERTNCKEKKETRWGWFFLLKGWAESTASSQRKHRGRKPQQS